MESGFLLSAVVGDPAKAVSTFLSPGGEGVSMWKRLSPYGAVFPDRSSEGWDALFSFCSITPHAANFGNVSLQAWEGAEHAYSLWFLLCSRRSSGAVQDGVAASADVSQHLLHWVWGFSFVPFIQSLSLTGTQWGFLTTRQHWFSGLCVSDCHQFLEIRWKMMT